MLRHLQKNYKTKVEYLFCKVNIININFGTACHNGRSFHKPSIKPTTLKQNHLCKNKFYIKPRQIWLENLDTIQGTKLSLVKLHPDVFGFQPRIDIIHENVVWQQLYRFVSYANTKVRSEVRGGGRKPWPQKGSGRARHGSIRSPLWRKGGVVHGPRSPTPYFYMLPFYNRVLGLTSTLSVKFAQNDLHVISDLELPNQDSSYILELIKERKWGPSVLFVDNNDVMPQNISIAINSIKHINLMPAYGLNVYSMLKHNTIVLTQSAVKIIEDKLLYHLHRINTIHITKKFKI